MARVRVIPVLLLARSGLVKTVRFTRPRYLGDPINAVKIFNDKRVDELMLLDIEATAKGRIALDWIDSIVSEAFMPIAYGGGVRTVDQCAELFRIGVEKVVINTAAFESPRLLAEASQRFGSQSIVVSLDVKKDLLRRPRVYVRGGRKNTGLSPLEAAQRCEQAGAGEILLTSIAREGTFDGYDIALLQSVASAVGVPVIANGGAGRVAHLSEAVQQGACSAVAAGSMFVFSEKGGGVLITYPSPSEIEQQCSSHPA